LILFLGETAWQTTLLSGDIIWDEQMSQGWELLGPGEFLQHPTQVDHILGPIGSTPRRMVRSQQGQPAEEVWITPQLVKRANLRIMRVEINEEVSDGSAIAPDGCVTQ
jgi:hypothetical protein